jgi:tRNA threonylcarbamoyladenosine biosynthesis protein TsaB
MKLLAIEAATEACSAAVMVDGEIAERYQVAPRQHNELILPMCEEVLAEMEISLHQLDAIAFGCGPGAFTGVRIAAGITQGIALAHDLPVASISTLANLAYQAPVSERQYILTSIDARMDEVYWAIYQKIAQGVDCVGTEQVQSAMSIERLEHSIAYGCGSGWGCDRVALQALTHLEDIHIDALALPRASVTAKLGQQKYQTQQVLAPENALPVYLRDQVAKKKVVSS